MYELSKWKTKLIVWIFRLIEWAKRPAANILDYCGFKACKRVYEGNKQDAVIHRLGA